MFSWIKKIFKITELSKVFGPCMCRCHSNGSHGKICVLDDGLGCGWCAPCAPRHILCYDYGNFYKLKDEHKCK